MDKLPPELIHGIASHLPRPLAGYATISSSWQHAIELRTFAAVTAYSGRVLFGQFKAVFAAVRRRTLLRNLEFYAKLPLRDEDDIIEQPPTRQEAAEDNPAYTRALIALFSFLHTWEHDGHARLTITLQTVTRLPADDDDDFERCGCGSCASQNHEGRLSAAMESLPAVGLNRKALHKSGGLATVPLVCSFTAGFSPGRHLDPAAIPLVARALPNARELRWAFAPSNRRLQGRRRAERLSFANALSSLAAADLRLLTTLTIHCVDEDPSNEGFNPASLVDRASGRDQLSVAFRHISQLPWLRRLCLTGCHVVGSEMFEDPDSSIADNVSTWPTLTYLELGISMTTPDGQWYFSEAVSATDTGYYYGDYDSDTSEAPWENIWGIDVSKTPSCRFRSAPDNATFTPFIISMVRAVARMPVLRRLKFKSDSWRPGINVDYFGSGEPVGPGAWSPAECAFHAARLGESRWALTLRHELDPQWSIPDDLRAALTKSTSEGCVLVTGEAEEVF